MSNSNEVFWKVWCYQQWPINDRELKDQYGFGLSDSRCTIKPQRNYVDTDIPQEYRNDALALEYVETLRMPYREILEMPYDEFYKVTLLHRAVSMKRPVYTTWDFYKHNSGIR